MHLMLHLMLGYRGRVSIVRRWQDTAQWFAGRQRICPEILQLVNTSNPKIVQSFCKVRYQAKADVILDDF